MGTQTAGGAEMESALRRRGGQGGPGDLERLGEPSWGKTWLQSALAAPEAPRVRRPDAARAGVELTRVHRQLLPRDGGGCLGVGSVGCLQFPSGHVKAN